MTEQYCPWGQWVGESSEASGNGQEQAQGQIQENYGYEVQEARSQALIKGRE